MDSLPYIIIDTLHNYDSKTISAYGRWEDENGEKLRNSFCETNKYGNLHLDSLNRLIAIGESNEFYNGRIIDEGTLVFKISNLIDVAFDVDVLKSNEYEIKGNIKISFSLTKPNITIRNLIIKKAEKIHPIEYTENQVMFTLPPPVQLLWDEIINIINNTIANIVPIEHEQKDIIKAMGLYMVDENYTLEEIKKQRNRLMKAFHPDTDKTLEAAKRTQIINSAYELLEKLYIENQTGSIK